MRRPSLFSRIVSRSFAAFLQFSPVEFGKWRLRRWLAPWLVAQLDTGPWIRVSGVSKFEWDVLRGAASGEYATARVFCDLVKAGDVVLDVGANIGYYALTAASRVGAAGRVIAFEPDPVVAERIRQNVELNGMDNVTVVASAVGARDGTLQLHLGGWDSEASSVYLHEPDAKGTVAVPVTTLDDFLRVASIGHVAVLKIDAEGAELDILHGAQALLTRADAPVVIVEANPLTLRAAGVTVVQLRAALDNCGYVVSVIQVMSWRGEMVENWLATRP